MNWSEDGARNLRELEYRSDVTLVGHWFDDFVTWMCQLDMDMSVCTMF